MSTPQQRRSLTSDMMTETNNMAKATTKVVVKMNTLEEKVDQQVAMLERQLKGFKVHYLEGQKVVAQQAKEVSYRHQLMVEQVDKNTEQNGKIVGLLRELQDGVKASAARAEAEMDTCFEFAAKTDVDLKKSLGDSQDLYHRRHGEIRDDLSLLRDIVQGLATHVQGLQPLQSAVDDPAPATMQAQEPAEARTMQVLPNKEKLMKTFMKARKRMQTQRIFSELCKYTYRIKISKHDWCPETGVGLVEPDERWKHYMAHGTSHGIGRAGKGKRDGHEVIPLVDKLSKDATTPAPTKRVVSAVAAGVEKERQRSQPQSKKQASSGKEEASDSEDSDPSSPSTHGSSSDDEDKWCCNRRFRIEGKGGGWHKCNTDNDESATECQRCSMPRFDDDNEPEGADPRSTAGRPDDNKGQRIPPLIDGAAKCNEGEDEWDSQDVGSPVEQAEDETDVALLPLSPLPDDHHLLLWMRPNLVRKAELALSVAEATRMAQVKPRSEPRQSKMKLLIAETKEYQDLPLTAMQESMRKAYNESLAEGDDYALEVASAGKTPGALRRYRWNQLEAKRIPYLASSAKSAPEAWTPEAIVNFLRDPRVWQALLTTDDCKVTQWHRRVEELMREPDRAGKSQSKLKDKRERKIVAHMHFFMGLDKTSTTYKNRQVHKQRVHTIQSTPNYFEGLGEEGHMWDLEGLAHRMTLGQVLDAWSEEHQGDEEEETTATETEKSGVDTGDETPSAPKVSFGGEGGDGDGGSGSSSSAGSSGSSDDEGPRGKGRDKARGKKKRQRRKSTQVEIKLMAQSHKDKLAMREAKDKAKQLQEDCNQIKRDRATPLPFIDGEVQNARKSLRLFLVDAELGGYTAAEKVARVRMQTKLLDKKDAKTAAWCEATDRMALVEGMLVGNMKMHPDTMAKKLVEGKPAHSEEIWNMFTTEWNSSFPKETDSGTRESEILLLEKAIIDPHFVAWLGGTEQYNKYMKKGWRLRALGVNVSMTKLQRKTMMAALPRSLREYPQEWRDAWEIEDGPIVPFHTIREYYTKKKINFYEKFTSAYNAAKVSPGIGLTPDDPNHSDHEDQYTLKVFPQVMRTKEWGFDRHGQLKLTREERALLPGGRRSSSKRAKTGPVEVSGDEADAVEDCWDWYEADEAEVRAIKHAKLSDKEFKQCIAEFSLKPRDQNDCAFVAIHRNKKYKDKGGGKPCPCRMIFGGNNKTLEVPAEDWQRAWEKVIRIYKQNPDKREATRMMQKLRDGYKEKWVGKGYAREAQADSAEATKRKTPKRSRSRRSKNAKASTEVAAKVETAAAWSVAKASSSSGSKSSDSEDSSTTDSEDSADDDEVEVCEVGCASEDDAFDAYWEEQQCILDGVLSSDGSLEEAYEADGECSDVGGNFTDIDDQAADQDQPLLLTPPGSPRRTRAAPASMPYMALQRAISAVTAGVTKLRMRAAGEDQVEPLALTLPGTPSRKLIRAAPASMPYMTLEKGGTLKPCSRGEGSNACDVCAEAGAGNSARLAALKHASL